MQLQRFVFLAAIGTVTPIAIPKEVLVKLIPALMTNQKHLHAIDFYSCAATADRTLALVKDLMATEQFYTAVHATDKRMPFVKASLFRRGIVLDLNCNSSQRLIRFGAKNRLVTASLHWLLLCNTANLSTMLENLLPSLPISANAELTLVTPAVDDDDLKSDGGTVNVTKMGTFNIADGLSLRQQFTESSVVVRRQDLQTLRLKCMIVITTNHLYEPFEKYLEHTHNSHLDSMHRFNFALLDNVRRLFNFTFEMHRTNSWGYLRNGTFDGMIGALVRRDVDIGGSPAFFRTERARAVDFTAMTWIARPCFIFRHPKTTPDTRNVFVQPFTARLWYAIATTILVFVLLIAVAFRRKKSGCASCKATVNEKSRMWRTHRFVGEWSGSVVLCIGTLCQQGTSLMPYGTFGRGTVLSIFVFTFLIYQFYSATVVGSLIMKRPKTMTTLRHLIDSRLILGIEDILYNRDFFWRTTDPEALELYAKKIVVHNRRGDVTGALNFWPIDRGMAYIRQGGAAFHTDVATAYRIILDTFSEREICELAEITLFPPGHMVTVVQKQSPYRKIFSYGLRRAIETGLAHRERQRWHSPTPKCVRRIQPHDLQVELATVISAIEWLAMGVAASVAILGGEILVHTAVAAAMAARN